MNSNPAILILDEATGALDAKSEHLVLHAGTVLSCFHLVLSSNSWFSFYLKCEDFQFYGSLWLRRSISARHARSECAISSHKTSDCSLFICLLVSNAEST